MVHQAINARQTAQSGNANFSLLLWIKETYTIQSRRTLAEYKNAIEYILAN